MNNEDEIAGYLYKTTPRRILGKLYFMLRNDPSIGEYGIRAEKGMINRMKVGDKFENAMNNINHHIMSSLISLYPDISIAYEYIEIQNTQSNHTHIFNLIKNLSPKGHGKSYYRAVCDLPFTPTWDPDKTIMIRNLPAEFLYEKIKTLFTDDLESRLHLFPNLAYITRGVSVFNEFIEPHIPENALSVDIQPGAWFTTVPDRLILNFKTT